MMSESKEKEDSKSIKSVSVVKWKVVDGVAFYIVAVEGGTDTWCVVKRYSQFESYHTAILLESAARKLPPGVDLPPKRMRLFVSHVTPAFCEERRVLLDNYLKKVCKVSELARCESTQAFLKSDKDSSQSASSKDDEENDLPDDVEITNICIPAKRMMSDHVLFQIDVVNSRKRKSFSKWTVLKRFGQFYEMDAKLREDFKVSNERVLDSLPPGPDRKSKLLVDHMDESFVEQRRVLLESYLRKMLRVLPVVRHPVFLDFLGVEI